MKVVLEAFGRIVVFSLQAAKLSDGEDCEETSQPEFDHIPVDPHSVGGGLIEHGPGADSYISDVMSRRFGFHGRQD